MTRASAGKETVSAKAEAKASIEVAGPQSDGKPAMSMNMAPI
eukprot:CAMPEP_0114041354 /NCGR_PEP_ID=MMETSP1339-20121228/4757_1 /TAXON_ID=94617 /ORGANISM="Fibrocapsa japonica" /LENGTH=41 /assembly_acc=CAM_ASM_000762